MNQVVGSTQQRIPSIDIMRGMVILLMMLDHVRERFFMHTRTGDPMYDTIEPDLFFTRFITHFCAPIFIFLAGLSAWLYAHPAASTPRSPSGFLFKLGMVIIAIEIVLYYLVWADSFPNYLFLQVLWAIGLCMVALSLACRLNYWVVGVLGFAIVLGHNALVPINFEPGDRMYIPWTILHNAGTAGQLGGLTVSISYPALPWFGVILLGYFAGPFPPTQSHAQCGLRRLSLLRLGPYC
ncbi:MAG: DUF1624 domain-containing protein [Acidiferrobacterales bacterium]|nr:DUF1624 domain-containing protein [Acidiferrobacterales bacterium]